MRPLDATPKPSLEVHGGMYLGYYVPLAGNAPHSLGLAFAYMTLEGQSNHFGVHIQPRFSDTKMRTYYPSNLWVQEAYAYWESRLATVKVGKIYSRLGRFWDGSFYGNVQYFDGMKLSPDYGVSVEGDLLGEEALRIHYDAQYFVNDGVTNGAMPQRDTVATPHGHKRDEVVLRVAPAYFFSKEASAALGVSGQYFRAKLPELSFDPDVYRVAVDASFTLQKGWSAYAEYTRQTGQSVSDYPFVGRASRHEDYVLVGAQLLVGRVIFRYDLSAVWYSDVATREWIHMAGIEAKLHDNVSVYVEYARWLRRDPNSLQRLDESANVTLHAHF